MKLWKRFSSLLVKHHDPCPRCHVRLQLTGKPPENHSECLVKKIVGERKSVPFHWLEEQVSDTLYRAELSRGAWVLDIGVWGPTLFVIEATRTLAEICPEFAFLLGEDGARLQGNNIWHLGGKLQSEGQIP